MSDKPGYVIQQWSISHQRWLQFTHPFPSWFEAFSHSKTMNLDPKLEISGNKNLPLPKVYWLGAWIDGKGKGWWRIVRV